MKSLAKLAAPLLAGVLFLAACSPGTETTGTDTTKGEATTDEGKALVEQAQDYVEEHTGEIAMPDPAGEDFTPAPDKTIGIMSCGQEAPACQRMVSGAEEALDILGYDHVMEDGKLTPTGWNTAMSRLIQKDVDGIIKFAAPDNAMPQSMKAAADAGIPVVCAVCSNAGSDPIADPTVANVDLDTVEQGRAQAWYAIAHTGGNVKMLVFKNELVTAMKERTDGMAEIFEQECGDGCEVLDEEEVTQSPGFEARLRSSVTSSLQKFGTGEVNMIASTSDSQALGAIQAVEQAGRTDDVKIVSSDCELSSLDSIRTGGAQLMCNNSALGWLGFAGGDLMARVLVGQSPPQGFIPSLIVDAEHNLPPEGEYVPDPDYVPFYKEQWGLS